MPQNRGIGILNRTDNTVRHICFGHVENRMHGSNDQIERGQNIIGIVQVAVRQDVRFYTLQYTKIVISGVKRIDLFLLFLYALDTQAMGIRGGFAVVADGMGGLAAGEVASSIAVTTIVDKLKRSCKAWPTYEAMISSGQISLQELLTQQLQHEVDESSALVLYNLLGNLHNFPRRQLSKCVRIDRSRLH